eukprot:TRINITY_DN1933_c2_g1_i1.p1 TRINITY_DN1933_c2_g1~~TRINITY_DN1933_c2_g1_i1.p1  ORF type:complete len:269 (+),score=49.52 TRINITY_DN1933_c2_g1_i1:236-1042(+)
MEMTNHNDLHHTRTPHIAKLCHSFATVAAPTGMPTPVPTSFPTAVPSNAPTVFPVPPTFVPTLAPTYAPTHPLPNSQNHGHSELANSHAAWSHFQPPVQDKPFGILSDFHQNHRISSTGFGPGDHPHVNDQFQTNLPPPFAVGIHPPPPFHQHSERDSNFSFIGSHHQAASFNTASFLSNTDIACVAEKKEDFGNDLQSNVHLDTSGEQQSGCPGIEEDGQIETEREELDAIQNQEEGCEGKVEIVDSPKQPDARIKRTRKCVKYHVS